MKAKKREYKQRPEAKSYNREYNQRPEVKAYMREYHARAKQDIAASNFFALSHAAQLISDTLTTKTK